MAETLLANGFVLLSNMEMLICLKRPVYIRNGAFMDATSFPGFSLLLRERKLVATGHEEMCVNKLRGGGRSSNRSFTKSCGLEDHEILSEVGRRFPLQNSVRCFLLVTITLYLEGRTGYFFIAFVLVQRFSNRPANRIYKILLDVQVQN